MAIEQPKLLGPEPLVRAPYPDIARTTYAISQEEVTAYQSSIACKGRISTLLSVVSVIIFIAGSIIPPLMEGYGWTVWAGLGASIVLGFVQVSIENDATAQKRTLLAKQTLSQMQDGSQPTSLNLLGRGTLNALDDRFATDRSFRCELIAKHPQSTADVSAVMAHVDALGAAKIVATMYAGIPFPFQQQRIALQEQIREAKKELLLKKKFAEYEERMKEIQKQAFGLGGTAAELLEAATFEFEQYEKRHFLELERLYKKAVKYYTPFVTHALKRSKELEEEARTIPKRKEAAQLAKDLKTYKQVCERAAAIQTEHAEIREKLNPYNLLFSSAEFFESDRAKLCNGVTQLEYLMAKEEELLESLKTWVANHFTEKRYAAGKLLNAVINTVKTAKYPKDDLEELKALKNEYKELKAEYTKSVEHASKDCVEDYKALLEKIVDFHGRVLALHDRMLKIERPGRARLIFRAMMHSTPLKQFESTRPEIKKIQTQMQQADACAMRLQYFKKGFLTLIALIVLVVAHKLIENQWIIFGVDMGVFGVYNGINTLASKGILSRLQKIKELKMQEHLIIHPVSEKRLKHLPEVAQTTRLGIDLPVHTIARLVTQRQTL